MTGFANPVVGGGGALVYPSIHSPGFVPGSAGWSIDKNGNAYFYGVTLTGGSLVITGAGQGVFLYSANPPAAGTLTASITQSPGTDDYGNAYLAGVCSYDGSGTSWMASQQNDALFAFWYASSYGGPWQPGPAIGTDTGDDLVLSAPGALDITTYSGLPEPAGYTFGGGGLAVAGASWQNLAGETGWVAAGAQWQPVPVIGAVAFRGTITTPSSGSYNGVAATQAISATPSVARRWPVVSSSAPLGVTGYAVLGTGGQISFQGLPGSYNGNNVEINGLVWL